MLSGAYRVLSAGRAAASTEEHPYTRHVAGSGCTQERAIIGLATRMGKNASEVSNLDTTHDTCLRDKQNRHANRHPWQKDVGTRPETMAGCGF